MALVRRVNNGKIPPGKVWAALGGAVVEGMIKGSGGSAYGLVDGVVSGAQHGAKLYDLFAGKERVDPYAGLGATAKARYMMRR